MLGGDDGDFVLDGAAAEDEAEAEAGQVSWTPPVSWDREQATRNMASPGTRCSLFQVPVPELVIAEALTYQRDLVLHLDAELVADALLGCAFRAATSAAVAPPALIRKLQCLSENWAPPMLMAAHADGIDQLPGRMVGRVLEEGAGVAAAAAGP